MKKNISIIIILLFVFSFSVNAKNDFDKNKKYYENICSKRTSFEINKKVCLDYEYYKENSDDKKVQKIQNSVNQTNLTADKLSVLINENTKLINQKTKEIRNNRNEIKANEKRIIALEKEILSSLGSVQFVIDENQIVDLVMASTSFEDLMTKVDGLTAINNANVEAVIELEERSNELEKTQKNINEDLKKLKKTKEKQESMIQEFRKKEASLYSKMNSGGSGAVFNEEISKLDLKKINETRSWHKPLSKGNVSAGTWYYPGGGWHPGVDIANKVGTPVKAPGNGALLATANSGSYGKHILVITKKGNKVYTLLYAHLNDFAGVNGFSRGDTIARSGNTGNSTGPHVHTEVFQHNTDDVSIVVSQYRKQKDYWFGLGYSSKGDCTRVCRLKPEEFFNLKIGSNY